MSPMGWVGGGDVDAAMLRIVKGDPDDVELAALVAGIVAARAAAQDGEPPDTAPPAWADPGRHLGVQEPGPSTWRWSLHP